MTTEADTNRLFSSCIDSLDSCLDYIEKYSEGEDKIKQTMFLKTVLCKDFCNVDLNYKKILEAAQKTEKEINETRSGTEINLDEIYKRYKTDVGEDDYLRHPAWNRIMETEGDSIQEVEEKPNISNVVFEKMNDSLLCSQGSRVTLDPLTKKTIQKPCKNTKCGHVYDYDTIMFYIKKKKRKVRSCPYMGCGNDRLLCDDIEMIDV